MKKPRRGKPVQPRTLSMCARFKARSKRGDDEREIISDLSDQFGIQRAAVWKALRSGGAVAPYKPKVEGSPGRPIGGGKPGYTAERMMKAIEHRSLATARMDNARPAPAEACPRCNVRADVGCRHQPATGLPPPAIEHPGPKDDKRFRQPGQMTGLAFHPERKTQSAVEAAGQRLSGLIRDEESP